MRNFIVHTIEISHVSYNVLVEDDQGEEDARTKFEKGYNDGRLVHDNVDVDIVKVEEAN